MDLNTVETVLTPASRADLQPFRPGDAWLAGRYVAGAPKQWHAVDKAWVGEVPWVEFDKLNLYGIVDEACRGARQRVRTSRADIARFKRVRRKPDDVASG